MNTRDERAASPWWFGRVGKVAQVIADISLKWDRVHSRRGHDDNICSGKQEDGHV